LFELRNAAAEELVDDFKLADSGLQRRVLSDQLLESERYFEAVYAIQWRCGATW
jgi:hypothetical protein